MTDNVSRQAEEIEALSAIYGEDWTVESQETRSYNIRIAEGKKEAYLYVTLPLSYPNESPPKYELSAPWMDRKEKEKLHLELDEVYLENIGDTVIFQWVEKIREKLQALNLQEVTESKPDVEPEEEDLNLSKLQICPEIAHSDPIVDRKSIFQGHAAKVHSIEEVQIVLNELKKCKKIANAFHNMYAYRIERATEKGSVMVQDCDDDGEAHAGGRMLHLLQILDQRSTLVVVSRWYGGIQLGPDRFRHINNATRQAIERAGLLNK